MKKALIDITSKLVVQVENTVFDVAPSNVWVDCPDYIVANQYIYENNQFSLIVTPPPIPSTAEEVRKNRNQKLTESDWTQLSDAPVNKQVWATYRQALRDVPNQSGFPTNVVWPQKP